MNVGAAVPSSMTTHARGAHREPRLQRRDAAPDQRGGAQPRRACPSCGARPARPAGLAVVELTTGRGAELLAELDEGAARGQLFLARLGRLGLAPVEPGSGAVEPGGRVVHRPARGVTDQSSAARWRVAIACEFTRPRQLPRRPGASSRCTSEGLRRIVQENGIARRITNAPDLNAAPYASRNSSWRMCSAFSPGDDGDPLAADARA